MYQTSGQEQPDQWRSLADILPKREYEDLTDQVPGENEVELPHLPPAPDPSTVAVPKRRATRKVTFQVGDYVMQPVCERLRQQASSGDEDVNDYGTGTNPAAAPLQRPSSSSSTSITPTASDTVLRHSLPQPSVHEPDSKRPRHSVTWVEELEAGAAEEAQEPDLFSVMEEVEEFLHISFDLPAPSSNRQRKLLERNPCLYLVKQHRNSEVSLQRLHPQERELFCRAKAKEVESFVRNEAVRKCLDDAEVSRAYDSKRIVKARWVLTWKLVPPEDHEMAKKDAIENPETLHDWRGERKAKARIVLLGFQHPSLLDPAFKTSSPVQSTLGRNLLYLMSAHHQWPLEGLDLATAFLQTNPTEADSELWTTGVAELRAALGVSEDGILRILRNIYGSTTAPRGLWLDLHKTLCNLGAVPILGERCLWVWLSSHVMDQGHPKVIGAMGGHVDDFHRLGDPDSEEWRVVKASIDSAYKWGMIKSGAYRHAGTDLQTLKDSNGNMKVVVDQEFYVDGLQDLEIDPDRLRQEGPLTKAETAACRGSLGGLQWLAVQTQPQLCSRCNLLLTEVVTDGTLQTAREIQAMIGEIRREHYKLEFFKMPKASHWTDIVFISMGDQAHGNRPKGDSTGGLLTMAAGPEVVMGKVSPMCLLAWRTWKLKCKAILEAEDQNYRTRLIWTELHGAGHNRENRQDLVEATEKQALMVKGVLCTDSRGGYDAVELNESPLLGLSNMRAALQAFQLRDNLKRAGCELRWLASDYDLADAMTKKKADSRTGLLKFLQTWLWSIAFDPTFTSSRKCKQRGHSAVRQVDRHLSGRS